jgi:signal transduction histidine kinase
MVESHGKGRLEIKTAKAGGLIRITFRDDGPGIPEENLKRIFDPFFTTKEVGKGTGLGLSICYGLVVAHGGHIHARSKPGEGAAFVVEIPLVSEDSSSIKARVPNPHSRGMG